MPSAYRRALPTFLFGIALITLGVGLIRVASLTQNWVLVALSIPALFVGVVKAADGLPKRSSHKALYQDT